MDIGKIPPHDTEAEQAVLGSMLTDQDAVIDAIEVLKPEDFYREDNKYIYEAILNLYNKAEPIDIITVKSELISMGKFEVVGGFEYLGILPDKVPLVANAQRYIKIVEEKSLLRQLIKASNDLIELGYAQNEDVEMVMDQAEKKIFNIMQGKNQKGFSAIKDVLIESFAEIEKLYNQKEPITGVPTGFADLDYKTAGLHNSDLVLIAARPAMGKSAFALNIASHAAINAKVPVAIFNLEMSKSQLVNRMLCSEAMVDSNKIRTGKIEENDWVKLATALGPLSEAPIYIDDTAGISIAEIRAKCRKLKLEKNIGLIVIDYLQLIQGSGKRNASREQEISEISRSLKILAKELDVPVIALSQLSRAAEQRQDHRPMLSDLRESGAIEQDADIVMFLYRDDYYNPDTEKKNIAEVIMAKHRAGSTGTINLIFKIVYWINILAFIAHTVGMGLRWYIAEHAPWSDGYESLVFIAWCLAFSGTMFARSSAISLALTSILAGVTLFVAHLSWLDPQITNLVPVLQSYWLTIHVSVITASYGFLGLCSLLGLFTLVLFALQGKKENKELTRNIIEATRINEMAMILGLSLLVVGNFLGGVWANESWGRYWGWDSKETWALVSILVYAAVVHMRFIPKVNSQYAFAVASMFAYSAIIMTYFGVNFYLVGMHSYAAGDAVPVPNFVWIALVVMVVISLLAYRKRSYSARL